MTLIVSIFTIVLTTLLLFYVLPPMKRLQELFESVLSWLYIKTPRSMTKEEALKSILKNNPTIEIDIRRFLDQRKEMEEHYSPTSTSPTATATAT